MDWAAPPSLLKWLYVVCLPSKLEGQWEKKDILFVKKVRKMNQMNIKIKGKIV